MDDTQNLSSKLLENENDDGINSLGEEGEGDLEQGGN